MLLMTYGTEMFEIGGPMLSKRGDVLISRYHSITSGWTTTTVFPDGKHIIETESGNRFFCDADGKTVEPFKEPNRVQRLETNAERMRQTFTDDMTETLAAWIAAHGE